METLLTGWNGVHDFLSFLLVINLKSKKVLWSSQLELGGVGLLVVFNDDFFSFWQVLLLSSHNLDEFLQVLDFPWLFTIIMRTETKNLRPQNKGCLFLV